MKRFATILLVLAMLASMGTIAYAEDSKTLNGNPDNNAEISVTGEFAASVKPETKYSVNVSWQSLTFNYTLEDHRVWNTQTHRYDGNWVLNCTDETAARTVTVMNRSDAAVKISAELKSMSEIPGIDFSLKVKGVAQPENKSSQTLKDASIDAEPQYAYFTVAASVSMTPTKEEFESSKGTKQIGQLVITVQTPDGP